jgi:hypothetical protein
MHRVVGEKTMIDDVGLPCIVAIQSMAIMLSRTCVVLHFSHPFKALVVDFSIDWRESVVGTKVANQRSESPS